MKTTDEKPEVTYSDIQTHKQQLLELGEIMEMTLATSQKFIELRIGLSKAMMTLRTMRHRKEAHNEST